MEIVKNKNYIADIVDIGENGFGIGKIGDFTVFVNGGLPLEKVEVKIIKVKKSYCVGKLIRVLEKSKHRVNPPCPVYRRCGGCQLMDMSYSEQLNLKKKRVCDCLKRIGGFNDIDVSEVVGMDNPYYYRNKAQFPVRFEKGETKIGFFAQKSHNIINCEDCMIQNKVNKDIILAVRKYMSENNIKGYNEETGRGDIRHIFTRVGYKTNEIMVCIVINCDSIKNEKDLVNKLKEIPNVASILVNINKNKTNVILGDEIRVLWGKDKIIDFIGDIAFEISAKSFFQVNPVQTLKLYNKVVELADFKGDETVIDLYCGIGTISLFVAKYVKNVFGVEIVPEAIEDALKNAKLNDIENAKFYVGKAEEVIPSLYHDGLRGDVVILDPPRKGCEGVVLETILNMKPERIVYVSCEPSTLARDLKVLCEGGMYEVKRVCPFDMFPQTGHVETVVLMSKVK